MLSFLKITNLAILDEISLEPAAGLNVLTGETGAGKSIIVDAIGLLLGERGGAEMIRTGCDRLVVEAQFDLSRRADAAGILDAIGVDPTTSAGDLVIRRELVAQESGARGRALVNGQLVTLAALKELGDSLADLHGQHQHQSLLTAAGQRDTLDAFAGVLGLRTEVGAICGRLRALRAERELLAARESERARQDETLRRQIGEIDAADPLAGEEEELLRDESLLRHAEEVVRQAGRGFALLSEDDDSVIARLAAAEECVARLAGIDARAEPIATVIRDARTASSEAARALGGYLNQEAFEPARLEQVGARLAELDRLKRKYGPTLAEVIHFRSKARTELAALGGAAARLGEIDSEMAAAGREYASRAGALSERRRRAARLLEKAIEGELRSLAMEGTRVAIQVAPAPQTEPGPRGTDDIEYLIAPNRGEQLRPLSRIASGGELSRLMLAVRNAAEGRDDGRALIFDEIDSGIGGAVAEAVGRRLAALARRQQILCVTHLPQIASFADRHFRITKRAAGARTRAEVEQLDAAGRVEELARMLGDSETRTARRHAEALVNRATRPGKAGA
ncbi:MAG TPA: DNA repair protein RecN [Candidatus Polarisedimenticolia bacterium]|jgi:DNA repair protein RecN (Recombination protein N)